MPHPDVLTSKKERKEIEWEGGAKMGAKKERARRVHGKIRQVVYKIHNLTAL